MIKTFSRFIFVTFIFTSCFYVSTIQASDFLLKKANHSIELKSNDMPIGTLWVEADFKCHRNLVEVIRAEGGFTRATEDPQYIFSEPIVISRYDPEFSRTYVDMLITVEATGHSGIEIARSESRMQDYTRINERRIAHGLPVIDRQLFHSMRKRKFRVFVECSKRHRVIRGCECKSSH